MSKYVQNVSVCLGLFPHDVDRACATLKVFFEGVVCDFMTLCLCLKSASREVVLAASCRPFGEQNTTPCPERFF